MHPVNGKTNRFTTGSWLVLAFSVALILLCIFQTIYRFEIPTDGWLWHAGAFGSKEQNEVIYDANLVGNPSPLQPGDRLTAVAGLPVSGGDLSKAPGAAARLAGLKAGSLVEYSLLRGNQAIKVHIRLTHWTVSAWLRENSSFYNVFYHLTNLLLLAIGFFTFLKRPELPSARAFLVWCTVNFCLDISYYFPSSLYNFLYPVSYWGETIFSKAIYFVLLAPSLLAFTLVFPKPKSVVKRRSWIALAPFFAGLLIGGLGLIDARLGVLGWIGLLLMLLASALNLIHSAFTQKDAVSRAQLRWAVWGVTLGIAISLLIFIPAFNLASGLLADILDSVSVLGLVIIGICLSIAILRYRLWDIDVIIRRTLIYGLLTAALALVYFSSVILLESLFRDVLGGSGRSQAAIVISTLGVAALFSPLRRWIQNLIDRRFFRRNYNAQLILQDFASVLRDEIDINQLSSHLVNTVEETMQPSRVFLWLNEPDRVAALNEPGSQVVQKGHEGA